MKKILICDDQESVHETIGEYLKLEGMEYVSGDYCGDGWDGGVILEYAASLYEGAAFSHSGGGSEEGEGQWAYSD